MFVVGIFPDIASKGEVRLGPAIHPLHLVGRPTCPLIDQASKPLARRSNDRCEQFNDAYSDHQHGKC